jgi:hypothetical protein
VPDCPEDLDFSNPRQFRLDFSIRNFTRIEARQRVAAQFLSEQQNSLYRYDVESTAAGHKVYLTRPTPLNKGFDFQVHFEGFSRRDKRNRVTTRPRFIDIINDLCEKKKESSEVYGKLYLAIRRVYCCEEPDEILSRERIAFNIGIPVDGLLSIVKWLFIEQDMAYWNYRGRRKFMSGIEEEV